MSPTIPRRHAMFSPVRRNLESARQRPRRVDLTGRCSHGGALTHRHTLTASRCLIYCTVAARQTECRVVLRKVMSEDDEQIAPQVSPSVGPGKFTYRW